MKATLDTIITPALARLLPEGMGTIHAKAMLLAIGAQESGLRHRAQLGGGPARGLWQFERGGVTGVLRHPRTRDHAITACWRSSTAPTTAAVYHNLATDDHLACAFARLLLWTLPGALAGRDDHATGWDQYIQAWRPGKPRQEKWDQNFRNAWDAVSGGGK